MATSLLTEEFSAIALANELFSTTEGLIVLIPHRNCQNPFSFTVPSGCYALVKSKGVDLDYLDENGERSAVWPPGLHFPYPPWYQISYLVTKQSVLFEASVKECKTLDDIEVDVNIGVSFRIMGETSLGEDSYLVRKFAYQLRPSGLEQQLRGALGVLVRSHIRNCEHNAVYKMRNLRSNVDDEVQSEKDRLGSDSLEVSASFEEIDLGQRNNRDKNVTDSMKESLNEQFK